VRRADLADRLDGDARGGHEEHGGHERGGERLGLAVAVGVVGVGRRGGDGEAAPDDQRGDDVGRRLDRVGDEGVRVAEDAGGELDAGEQRVDREADLRGTDAGVRARRGRAGHLGRAGWEPGGRWRRRRRRGGHGGRAI
jgi:hypothetical protein